LGRAKARERQMTDSHDFSDETRAIQKRFQTDRLADKMLERVFRTSFTDADREFIENAMLFFLATVDADGRPQCSHKGGPRGFVRVTGPSELVFPCYEGNGLYLSMGNVASTGGVGLLFIDFEKQTRLRVNGEAVIDDAHPLLDEVSAAQLAVRVTVTDIHPNCPRNIHKMNFAELSKYTPKGDTENVGKAPWGARFDDVLPDYMKPDEGE